jgi:hypothetical protein
VWLENRLYDAGIDILLERLGTFSAFLHQHPTFVNRLNRGGCGCNVLAAPCGRLSEVAGMMGGFLCQGDAGRENLWTARCAFGAWAVLGGGAQIEGNHEQ